jgi:hypothetical protein
MAEDGADRKVSGTQAMNVPERADAAAGAPEKPAVSPTVIEAADADATAKKDSPPWVLPGRTQPGEPPLMDVLAAQPPRGFAAPAQPQNVPVVAPPPVPPMVPRYPPPMAPAPRRGGGGNLGLVIGGLVGLAMLIGVVVIVIAFRPSPDEPITPLGDFGSGSQPTEVKPVVPTDTVTAAPPPYEPEPAPAPKPVATSKPKPKPTTTAQPTATTQPTSQPTAQPTATNTDQPLPPPPPPATTSKPKLKLPPRPQ